MSRRAAKPLIRRTRADVDVTEAIDHYLVESSATAIRFVDALNQHRKKAKPRGIVEFGLGQ